MGYKGTTNTNSDPDGLHFPKKKYRRLRPVQNDNESRGGLCCIYLLAGLGTFIALWLSL